MEFLASGWSIDGEWRQYGTQLVSRKAWARKLERGRQRYAENRSQHNARTQARYRANREEALRQSRDNYQANRLIRFARERVRFQSDLGFRMLKNLRSATRKAVLRGWSKQWKTADMIGCTQEELRAHIESQFKPGMTWENYGLRGWHIDHVKPLSKVDVTNENEVRAALHYTNLQPLWWHENISKGNRTAQGGGGAATGKLEGGRKTSAW